MSRLMNGILLTCLLSTALAQPVHAQRGGDNDDRRDRGRTDPAEVLLRFDDNGDGVIQPNEVSERGRRYYERLLEDTGFDPNQPVVVANVVAAINERERRNQQQQGRQAWVDTPRNQSGDAAVPGFGEASQLPAVPGFGAPTGEQLPLEQLFTERLLREVEELFERYDRNNDGQLDSSEQSQVRWSSDPRQSDLNRDGVLDRREMAERIAQRWGDSARIKSGDRPAPIGGVGTTDTGGEAASKIRAYASSLLNQYDANKNGVLEKEEWSKMSGNPERADLNNDGVVTLDELANRLANFSRGDSNDRDDGDRRRGGWGSRGSSSGGSFYRSSGDRDDNASQQGGSYRFLAPAERLPKGTPSWFVKSDTDGDGQVAMHEFSATWSESKAAEFNKLDLDGNGRISPEEAMSGEGTLKSTR